jgi:hypothetical protein
VGSLLWMVKIDDKDLWENEIKKEGKFGFSVEGFMNWEQVSLSNNINLSEDQDFNALIDSMDRNQFNNFINKVGDTRNKLK